MTLRERVRLGASLSDLRIVDIHGHAGPYGEFLVHGAWGEDLLRTMDSSGIEVLLVSPHIGLGPDEEEANRQAVELAQSAPGRLLPYCTVNPNRSVRQIRSQLEQYVAGARCVGVKLHPSLHQAPITSARYEPVFEYAARARVPVLIHTWEGCPQCSPQALGELARRVPEVKLLMGHAGGTPAGYGVAAQIALDAPNVFLDITGSQSRAGALERLVSTVGASRVVYGSDTPFLDPRPKIGQVLFAELSDEVKRAILGGNARVLFGLEPVPNGNGNGNGATTSYRNGNGIRNGGGNGGGAACGSA